MYTVAAWIFFKKNPYSMRQVGGFFKEKNLFPLSLLSENRNIPPKASFNFCAVVYFFALLCGLLILPSDKKKLHMLHAPVVTKPAIKSFVMYAWMMHRINILETTKDSHLFETVSTLILGNWTNWKQTHFFPWHFFERFSAFFCLHILLLDFYFLRKRYAEDLI